MNKLKDVDSHFAFGENWADYAKNINERSIEEADKGLLRLITKEELQGKTFLDIGCGSGLHSLAALRLGASVVLATDIDSDSVATTKAVLERHAPAGVRYEVREVSVFDLPEVITEHYDIVYSWGVLHHTGAMNEAISNATKMVKPEGLFAVALYRKTTMCGVWRHIKKWYSQTNKTKQKTIRSVYINLLKLRYFLTGKDFNKFKSEYVSSRGMSFETDVHDWMGGYPYESISSKEVHEFLESLGFSLVRENVHPSGLGFFGSGCDEYLFIKKSYNNNV
ncbi:class I SAM-dependent methyltransferase [Candidatus Kaiserbacteria bacterium]|nr:class I SAM-dependent methyltransferase [Candidatus Kaiserbacteria bacterium]